MAVTYFVRLRALFGAVTPRVTLGSVVPDDRESLAQRFTRALGSGDERLLDELYDIHFHNTGPFYGKPPTGERGTMSETHAVRLRGGKIVEQFVGDNNFAIPHQELVRWGMDFPRDTPDPQPVLAEAGGVAESPGNHHDDPRS